MTFTKKLNGWYCHDDKTYYGDVSTCLKVAQCASTFIIGNQSFNLK